MTRTTRFVATAAAMLAPLVSACNGEAAKEAQESLCGYDEPATRSEAQLASLQQGSGEEVVAAYRSTFSEAFPALARALSACGTRGGGGYVEYFDSATGFAVDYRVLWGGGSGSIEAFATDGDRDMVFLSESDGSLRATSATYQTGEGSSFALVYGRRASDGQVRTVREALLTRDGQSAPLWHERRVDGEVSAYSCNGVAPPSFRDRDAWCRYDFAADFRGLESLHERFSRLLDTN